ncbi:hypothetical protein [Amycolatopsis sp. CFH S0078]|uniref:hypothetical protein n=1 Tax=Amycolatopsis sp. CFH S0078 TaxID=1644108 RepID=UPI00106E5B9A|nr:hypothetical protein [Amycolatopsis sp. CFH S0078]
MNGYRIAAVCAVLLAVVIAMVVSKLWLADPGIGLLLGVALGGIGVNVAIYLWIKGENRA